MRIDEVRLYPSYDAVYNFEVDDLHCYAVGRSGILVHNNNGKDVIGPNRVAGVGGNGAASEVPSLGGLSPAQATQALEQAGFRASGVSKRGWQTFKHPDGSRIDIGPGGRVVGAAAPKYGPDGSRFNKGQRLGPDGAEIPRSLPHDQHPPEALGD
jgi:hypothetical protein